MRDHVLSAADAKEVEWPLASSPPELAKGEVHLWSISLQAPPEKLDQLQTRLDAEEAERARRFLFDQHRRRFIAGRAALRAILGLYLSCPPDRIEFGYEGLGKPYLSGATPRAPLHFNLSNSGEMAVVAITAERPLGVDIEFTPRRCDFAALAKRYFSREEQQELFDLPADLHRSAFFRCWTRKEAMLKATGTGLTFPLDRFVVSLRAEDPPRVLSIEGCEVRAREWWLASFSQHPDYEIALALLGEPAGVKRMEWAEAS